MLFSALYYAELTFLLHMLGNQKLIAGRKDGKMATNKKQQVQEEGELSITCGKDLMLIAPQRLVLEGKMQHVGK